jgi:predicted nuclease of restriction endonuclease-like (RecB) superfamily
VYFKKHFGAKRIMQPHKRAWSFNKLVGFIQQVHNELSAHAGRAVNLSLTLRNWLIGYYIAEYELSSSDRASYGDNLLSELAKHLTGLGISNCNRRQLYRYLRFYRLYPEIVGTLPPQLKKLLPTAGRLFEKVGTLPPQLKIAPEKLIQRLSYSHLELIVDLDDDLKRAFYEIECMRGNWSVRELKRQINSLYFERSGLSRDKEKLAVLTQKGAEAAEPKLAIRDPYIFEFLGLKAKEVMSESHLEAQLLDKLQEFLLELWAMGFVLKLARSGS